MIAKASRFLAYAVLSLALLGIGSLRSSAQPLSHPASNDSIAPVGPADAPWSAAMLISDPAKGAWGSAFAMAPDGSACVLFIQSVNLDGSGDRTLSARCRSAAGSWGAIETVHATPTGTSFWVADIDIAMDDASNAYAVWSDNHNDPVNHTPDVFFASRSVAGVWTPPLQVNDEAQGQADAIRIATDQAGDAHVIWTAYQLNANDDGLTYYSKRTHDGTWSAGELVSNTAGRVASAIAVDGETNVYAVLATYDYSAHKLMLYFTLRLAAGSWSADAVIPNANGTEVSLALDGSNRLYASYTDFWNEIPYPAKLISRSAEGIWSAPEVFGTPAGSQGWPITAIAVGENGDVHAVWGPSMDGPKGTYVNFRLRPHDENWQGQETVWTPAIHGQDVRPQIALDDAGDVYVAWSTNDCTSSDCWEKVFFASRPAPVMPIHCQTQETLNFTQYYGLVTLIDGIPAPIGTVVRAFSPRGEEVGCMTTSTANRYGYLRVYGEDASVNPPIPGMRPSEQVVFKVNHDSVPSDPATVTWQDDKLAHQVHLGQAWSQWYAWLPGWNLFSTAVRPPDTTPGTVLTSASGKYDLVLGKSGTYAPPPADPAYNTLTEVTYGKAYWIRTTAGSVISPNISGFTMAVTTPLSLGASWQWVGYLPRVTLPISTALASISGKYDRVVGPTGSYESPPADPRFNTLTEMQPGQGYLIHMTSAGTLTYPADALVQTQSLRAVSGLDGACPNVAVTPYFTEYYGILQVDGADAPVGTVVKARNPRGDLVGCAATAYSGVYGYLRVYGEDATATPAIPGMRPGESVTFSVDGAQVTTAQGSAAWSDDKAHHQVSLSALNAPAAVTDLSIAISGASIQLNWGAVGGVVDTYEVWRGTKPYFVPGDAGCDCTKLGDTTDLSWLDSDASPVDVIGDVNINYFYTIRAINAAGPSAIGQRAGEFDFALAPGAAQ